MRLLTCKNISYLRSVVVRHVDFDTNCAVIEEEALFKILLFPFIDRVLGDFSKNVHVETPFQEFGLHWTGHLHYLIDIQDVLNLQVLLSIDKEGHKF